MVESVLAKHKPLESRLRAELSAVLIFLKKSVALNVYFVSNEEIRALNRKYRGKNKTTNVLSFQAGRFPRPDLKRIYLGEIFLAPDYIRSHKESISRLIVHGLLHLLGYTHSRIRDRIEMEALEDRIEARLKKLPK